jgi:hypothetical protein
MRDNFDIIISSTVNVTTVDLKPSRDVKPGNSVRLDT